MTGFFNSHFFFAKQVLFKTFEGVTRSQKVHPASGRIRHPLKKERCHFFTWVFLHGAPETGLCLGEGGFIMMEQNPRRFLGLAKFAAMPFAEPRRVLDM